MAVTVGQVYRSNFRNSSDIVIVEVNIISGSVVSTSVVDYTLSDGRSGVYFKGKILFYNLSSFSKNFILFSLIKEEDML